MAFYTTSDGINLFYEVKGEGKPIVLVHGWSQDSSVFQPQIEELSKEYKVVVYDHRGHGKSDRPEFGLTLNRFAVDLRELIDHLNLDNILLGGWSMGASTTFEYVKTYGVDKLAAVVLFDMTPKLINDVEWKFGLWHGEYTLQNALDDMTTMSNNLADFMEPFLRRAVPYFTDEMIDATMEMALTNTPHIMISMWLAMANNDYRDILEKITVPTTIAYGVNSTLYSAETAEYLNSKIPNSIVVPFEKCTHMLVMEDAVKATEVLLEAAKHI
ncbi:MAG TPA: alpha/beta hydrolase [Tissierellia bacterium]|jgi:non-heme chloroperoxidase|nr:alpha/beta hydrolase [Tissierellia bacterium]